MSERHTGEELAKTVERLHAPLLLFARQMIESEAEDLVQEAFLKLLRERQQGGAPIDNVSAWLFRVVRNEAISRLRRRTLLQRHIRNVRHQDRSWFEDGPDAAPDATELTEKIGRLPMELREILVARIWGGLSFQEIGEMTETSQSTAHRRYGEAILMLKEHYPPD